MTTGAAATPAEAASAPTAQQRWLDNRFLPPALITVILLGGHLSYGILEGYDRTLLAIVTSLLAEALLGRLTYGRWPHLASAYITGISVGILIRSPFVWPYVACSLISIASKYVLRVRGRHLWNPSNFGVCAMLWLAPSTVAVLSIQWGNTLWTMLIIWVLGAVAVWRVQRLHICATYVAAFLLLALVRSWLGGDSWLAEAAPITGSMYQLFVFFMITDPRTTVRSRRAQCAVVLGVAVAEAVLRMAEVVYAPFYALFLVGPPAMLVELYRRSTGRGEVRLPGPAA